MTREELREKVARAICKAVGLDICDDGCALCPTCLTEADAAIAIIRAGVLEEAAKVCSETCEKCSGYGWLWAHELDHYHNPDNRDPRSDPTRYSCDGEAHKTAAAIRALKDKL